MAVASRYDGLVIAGGRSRRMGGGDKTALPIRDAPMRTASITALAAAAHIFVIGPDGDLVEDPPGGGPLAAVAAGLARVQAPIVVVLAGDLPFVTLAAVETLVAQASAVAVDDEGRAQYLLAAYRTEELRRALPGNPAGCSLRSVIDALAPARVPLHGDPPPWWDCDTPDDLARARMWS